MAALLGGTGAAFRGVMTSCCAAAMLVAAPVLADQAFAVQGDRVGVAASVKGDVRADGPGGKRVLASGAPILLGDKVSSGAGASLQILLVDKTVFTVGPGSQISIDNFVFDPARNQGGELVANLARGVFRYVSGGVGKANPEKVNLKLPVGTIGIRGTGVMVMLPPVTGQPPVPPGPPVAGQPPIPGQPPVAGQPPVPPGPPVAGQPFIALLGPGPRNNGSLGPGGLMFEPSAGGAPVEVLRGGQGFTLGPNGVPGPIQPIPPQVIAAFNQTVAGPALPPPPQPQPGQAQPAPGQPGPGAPPPGAAAPLPPGSTQQGEVSGGQIVSMGKDTGCKSSDCRSGPGRKPASDAGAVVPGIITAIGAILGESNPTQLAGLIQPPGLPSGLRSYSTFSEMPASGSGVFTQAGVPIRGGALSGGQTAALSDRAHLTQTLAEFATRPQIGSYNFGMTVNFGARTVDWTVSHIEVSSLGVNQVSSPAPFPISGLNYSYPAPCGACGPNAPASWFANASVGGGKHITADAFMLSGGTDPAGKLLHVLTIHDGSPSGPALAAGPAVVNRQ